MTSRKILHVVLATSVALGTTAIGSAVYASPGHDDEKPAAKQQDKKAKTLKRSKADAKAEISGALGTFDAPRDIAITMTDTLRFDPGTIVVAEGETVRFLLDNPTVAPHDFLIGDLEEQLHHHEEMATGAGHDETAGPEGAFPAPVTLEPGESAEVVATFSEAGQLLIGCHVLGHWEAGMRGTVTVVPPDLELGTIDAPRDVAITMTDTLRFDPGTIVVAEGETVRFLLDNPTVAPHDFLIGDLEEQLHHHEEMATGAGHDETAGPEGAFPAPVTLEPGESAEVVATFSEAGQLLIGCHVLGHWEAGMRGTVTVVPPDLELGTIDAPRDVAITMTDTLRFDPGTIVVAEGETVRFLLDNPTVAPHDFLIGDLKEQLHHHEEMATGEGHDDETAEAEGEFPPPATLGPGESAEVLVTFAEAGELLIGCHVPGHWEAGMRGTVSVAPSERFPMA